MMENRGKGLTLPNAADGSAKMGTENRALDLATGTSLAALDKGTTNSLSSQVLRQAWKFRFWDMEDDGRKSKLLTPGFAAILGVTGATTPRLATLSILRPEGRTLLIPASPLQ